MSTPPASSHVATLSGEIYNHRLLWHTVESLSERGDKQPEGSYHCYLAASMFVYFAFEAFLNFVGDRLAPNIWLNEHEFFSKEPHKGTYGKFRYLGDVCGLKLDHKSDLAGSLRDLQYARFAVVHAKVELVNEVFHASTIADLPTHKEPVVFKYGEAAFCHRVMKDAETVADMLQQRAMNHAGEHLFPGPRAFRGMMWSQGGWLSNEHAS